MLIINNIPEPQGNDNCTHIFKDPTMYIPTCDPSWLWTFLPSDSKCYFQGSVYNMKFLTWELRTESVPYTSTSPYINDTKNLT